MPNVCEPMVRDVRFFDSGASLTEKAEPAFAQIASILFPGIDVVALAQNEVNDVMHMLAHHDSGGDIFVTGDLKDFIAATRRISLRDRWGIIVMTPDEAVAHLRALHQWS